MTHVRYAKWLLIAAAAAVVVVFYLHRPREPSRPNLAGSSSVASAPPPASFVGSAACASCHRREDAMWRGSHHAQAMQPADATTVLGDFRARSLRHAGVQTRFFRRGDAFLIETDGPDGALHEYEIAYTLGVSPLQQYLVSFPGGRLQALEVAWDSRPRAEGGQRWFHLYPAEKIRAGDQLHWTGLTENWNGMCADCHSTNVRKSYDDAAGTFATTYAEMSVGCEACHGPGSRHITWAEGRKDEARTPNEGLVLELNERKGVAWTRDIVGGKPRRSRPRASTVEIQMCGRCHSRRGVLHEDAVHGQPLGDDYRVALLDEDLYYDDGQIRGEVYEYGSFVESRMFAEGVTCGDCHEPHQPRLRDRGNEICLACHAAEVYQTSQHHFHPMGSTGARCVSCHMPAVTYMVVHERRDHSFRVPRPDQSVRLGVPNVCNACHAKQSPAWAARWIEDHYGHTPSGHQRFAEALFAARTGAPGASKLLSVLVADASQPAIARATALERLRPFLGPRTIDVVRAALADPDALVRRAAVRALADVEPAAMASLAAPRLDDPVRDVRLEASAQLTAMAHELSPPQRAALDGVRGEYFAAQKLNADRPDALLNLALVGLAEQRFGAAEAELTRALAIDPTFAPAAVNLADLYRVERRDAEAEPVLRAALLRSPDVAALWEAWGLLLVREKRLREALEPLGKAAKLAPNQAHYAVVHATALHDSGKMDDAIRELGDVLARHAYDREALAALAAFHREKGDERAAVEYGRRLRELAAE